MKRLTESQARRCEEACNPRCRCRCGGALHGANRAKQPNAPRQWFEQLEETDPHKVTERKPGTKDRPPQPKYRRSQLPLAFEA